MVDRSSRVGTANDIVGGAIEDWLVIGWFTPDYRPLAEKFAANLSAHGVPHHLFAKHKPANRAWCTQQKPSVVLEAMDAYLTKTLILMDVDCVVHGDIAPTINTAADVATTVIARNMRKGHKWRHWIAVESSSRVVVFRPTHGAREFAEAWKRQIEQRPDINHDEHSMVWAFLSCPTTRFSYIDQRYSGRNVGQIPGAVIEHDSAHDEARRAARGPVLNMLRGIEARWLRSGRTRQSRLKGEMSKLLQA